MTLAAGTRLGPHEIVAGISHGGRGEVLRPVAALDHPYYAQRFDIVRHVARHYLALHLVWNPLPAAAEARTPTTP